jgi:hypothetical protein
MFSADMITSTDAFQGKRWAQKYHFFLLLPLPPWPLFPLFFCKRFFPPLPIRSSLRFSAHLALDALASDLFFALSNLLSYRNVGFRIFFVFPYAEYPSFFLPFSCVNCSWLPSTSSIGSIPSSILGKASSVSISLLIDFTSSKPLPFFSFFAIRRELGGRLSLTTFGFRATTSFGLLSLPSKLHSCTVIVV